MENLPVSIHSTPITSDKKGLLESNATLDAEKGNVQYGSLQNTTDPVTSVLYQNKCSLFLKLLKTLTTEPLLFCFLFSYMLNLSTLANLIMDKGCRFYYNYTEDICSNLSAHKEVKDAVEILATDYTLYGNLTGLIAAVAMIFIAPWSDKYGRKLPLYLALFSSIFSDICLLLCIVRFDSPLIYLVLARIPSQVFGGFICMLTIIYSHAAEVSTEVNRTLKFMTVEVGLMLGMSLGALTGGLLLRYYGYFYVYLTALMVHVVCIPWVLFVVEETKVEAKGIPWIVKIKDVFAFENLQSGWKVSVRKRENYGRAQILLFYASMCIIVLMYESFGSIAFVYVHHLYNWDPATYNIVNTSFSLSQLLIVILVTPLLTRMYHVSDFAMGIAGIVSLMAKNATIAYAHLGQYVFYLGNALGYLNTLSPLAVRSGISKIVDREELGRVFSFLSTCEAVFPMVGTILVTKVFNATINFYPSISYLMTVVFMLLPLGTFTWAYLLQRRDALAHAVASPYKNLT